MAVNYSKYSDKQLEAMKAANSSDWHTAGTQAERDAYHQANIEINKVLDSRKGTTSTFDSGTGKWSTSGGKSSSSSKGSSGSSGGSSGSSGGGFSPSKSLGVGSRPYATDDRGQTDYSVLLNDAMRVGAGTDEVERLLGLRTDKALGDDSLLKYAYDDTYAKAMEYITKNKKPQQPVIDMSEILGQINSAMSQYQSPRYELTEWDRTKDALAKAALEMNYDDWTKSDQYAALLERYGLQGEMSMRDVLGQINSRTGGLASSYATTAAQQQYNQYMSQLEEVARQMYAGERADAIQNAQLAGEYSDSNYQRYLDRLAQYNTDRSFSFGVLSDVLDRSFQREQWKNTLEQQKYQKERDALSDQRYDDETAYGRGLDAYNQGIALRDDARARIGQYFVTGGGLDNLDPALIEQSQYTPAELEAMERYYVPQQEEYMLQSQSASGGLTGNGGYNNGRLTSEQVMKLQAYLNSRSNVNLAEDGFWGPASQAAAGGLSADQLWEEYQGGARTYDELVNAIEHINPGVTENQILNLLQVIEEAREREVITQAQYDELGRRFGKVQ